MAEYSGVLGIEEVKNWINDYEQLPNNKYPARKDALRFVVHRIELGDTPNDPIQSFYQLIEMAWIPAILGFHNKLEYDNYLEELRSAISSAEERYFQELIKKIGRGTGGSFMSYARKIVHELFSMPEKYIQKVIGDVKKG